MNELRGIIRKNIENNKDWKKYSLKQKKQYVYMFKHIYLAVNPYLKTIKNTKEDLRLALLKLFIFEAKGNGDYLENEKEYNAISCLYSELYSNKMYNSLRLKNKKNN